VRRILILLVACTLLATAFIAVQPAAPQTTSHCTQHGTPDDDIMAGTKRGDVMCSRGGNDYAHGDGGKDHIRGGPGEDTLVGGGGRDVLRGGAGDDRLFSVDDRGGGLLIGGKGRDQCFADPGDRVRGCESTFRGMSLKLVRQLVRTAYQVMLIADEALPTPPPPVGTITETIVTTVPFPPCSPAPITPPPIC
jgi:hypothetical protein